MSEPLRSDLIALRREGYTREEIAEHYGVTLATVRRWIKLLRVPRPVSKRSRHVGRGIGSNGEIVAPYEEGLTVLEQASRTLGSRFSEKRGVGYTLDGRPVSTAVILAAAGLKFKDDA